MTLERIKQIWAIVQDFAEVKGGLYVDAFAIVMIVRLVGPMFHMPAMTAAEAGVWAATISAFAYSNGTPKQS